MIREREAENIKVENIARRAGGTYNKPGPIIQGATEVLGQVLILIIPFLRSHTSICTRSEFRFGRGPSAPHIFASPTPPQHRHTCQNFPLFNMVKVEIVEEHNSPYASSAPSRTNSSESLSSIASDVSAPDESFYDRLSALVDIVPPATRQSMSSSLVKTTSFIKKTGKVVGNVVWIVTTSALLIGLPLALSLEDEAKIVQQEQEMLAQQQGAQQVLFFSPSPRRRFSAFSPVRCSHPDLRTHPQVHHNLRKKLSCLPAFDPKL